MVAHCVIVIDSNGEQTIVERGWDGVELHRPRQLGSACRPMIGLGYLRLLEEQRLDRNELRVLPDGRTTSQAPGDGFTLAALLHHEAMMRQPRLLDAIAMPHERREATVSGECRRGYQRWQAGLRRSHCSELSTWWLLDGSADQLLGGRGAFVRWLAGRVVGVIDSDRLYVRPNRELMELPPEAFAVPVAAHRGRSLPLLGCAGRRTRSLTGPALGFFGSAIAVARYWHALGRKLRRQAQCSRTTTSRSSETPDEAGLLPRDLAGLVVTDDDQSAEEGPTRYLWSLRALRAAGSAAAGPEKLWYGHDGMGGSIVGAVDLRTGYAFAGVAERYCLSPVDQVHQVQRMVATAEETVAIRSI